MTHPVGTTPPGGVQVTGTASTGDGKVTASTVPVGPGAVTLPASEFRTAGEMMGGAGAVPIAPYEERDEGDRGPLTPVQAMTPQERELYGLAENETTVLRGKTMQIVPEYGMPARYLFARVSINRWTNRPDARIFASIEGLVFRANAYNGGIKRLSFDYLKSEDVPVFADFLKETRDPQIIARAHVTLGDGTEIVEEGTVRLSEIQLHPSRRDRTRMVASSPVARSNPLEIAKKRALARALRWGTGFGGTALDELPPADTEGARHQAGLVEDHPVALPAPAPKATRKKEGGP